MKNITITALALTLALPFSAQAQGFLYGKKPVPTEKLLRYTADALGLDETDLKITDVEKEGAKTRYKTHLADGTEYRCYVEAVGGMARIMNGGSDLASDASCVKKVGSGKGPEPKKSAEQLELEAG